MQSHELVRLATCRRGASAVEFSLAAPLLLMILAGAVELANVFTIRNQMTETARQTVRPMAIGTLSTSAVPAPHLGACDHDAVQYRKTTVTMAPGVYCGGLEIGVHANVSLEPGLSCSVLTARTFAFSSKSGVSIDLNASDCLKLLPKALRGAVVPLD